MKRGVYRTKEQIQCYHSKPTKRKEFLVDPGRVQLDQYMLKQIKKNKRSVKSLSKEVVALKKEVEKLQDQHDDYMLLEKTRAQDYSQSHLVFLKNKSQNRIALTELRPKGEPVSRSRNHSKESSLLSISSSAKSLSSHKYSSKSKKSKCSDISSSKSRLSRKIEELKVKALLQQNEKQKIKKDVKKKIFRALQQKRQAETPTRDLIKGQQPLEEDYQKLIELLKTSKTIKSPSINKDSPMVIHFKDHQMERKESLIVEQEEEKGIETGTVYSVGYIPIKSSRTVQGHQQERRYNNQVDDNLNLKSQTNLLESSPSRTPEQSPKKPKKILQMSRAVELRIVNQHHSEGTEGSGGFQGIFGSPAMEMRSGTVEMSFQGGDNSRKRLDELKFEFDNLVRQKLMSSDPREIDMLEQTIKSVVFSINELKGKLKKDSRDSA